MNIRLSFILLFVLLFSISCTSSRWIITDQNATDERLDPLLISERNVLKIVEKPTVQNPVITFGVYTVAEQEYVQRIQVERTIQRYKPRWGFLTLGLTGAAVAALAANTSSIMPSVSSGTRLPLNIVAAGLAVLSFSNMKPVGEPIFTGERELMRRSGTEVVTDTLSSRFSNAQLDVDAVVSYRGEDLFSSRGINPSNGTLSINLSQVADFIDGDIGEDTYVTVALSYNETVLTQDVDITRFLSPYVMVTSPVAVLRNAPVLNELNIITEVGEGSLLLMVNRDTNGWYRVRFGGSEVFLPVNAGEIEWMSESTGGAPDVFEFRDVPFGEIDVENSVPILKPRNSQDRAIILTNGFADSAVLRPYLGRDHELFIFYMRHALQMAEDQIRYIEMDSTQNWHRELAEISEMESEGSLFVYLSGFATLAQPSTIYFDYAEQKAGEGLLSTFIINEFERINPSALFLIADLEYSFMNGESTSSAVRSTYNSVLQEASQRLLRVLPNSFILFSHRPGQQSSIYTAAGLENQRHHIFNYYWADAIKKRNTRVYELIRHLENNVDYTSRRLHDRPQEIQAFGNFTLNITQ